MELFSYSLWLQPEGEVYQEFSSLIQQLSAKYHASLFEPHVTLLGGLPQSDEQDIIAKTKQLASHHVRPSIRLNRIGYQNYYFRALFVLADKTPELLKLNADARELFGVQKDEPPFMPHLSLLYGEYTNETKEKIISEIGKEHDLSFYPSVIAVGHSSGRENTWKIVRKLPFSP